MDGQSFLQLASGQMKAEDWRKKLLYEYYWEYNFPQTPTTFALRTDRYKLIQYHGVWDIDELYDLKNDPQEEHNMIFDKGQQKRIQQMRSELHQMLEMDGANRVPFSMKRSMGQNLRHRDRSKPAEFPPELMSE